MQIAKVTLHVGLGTFQPVTASTSTITDARGGVLGAGRDGARGRPRPRSRRSRARRRHTVVRALESAADPDRPGRVRALEGETRLLIQPGHAFHVVDQLLTNFHLPQSTLLALVAAFAGRERVLSAYAAAVAARYRFYSYGDAMLIRARADGEAA